jgi:aspartate/methionine/tyrosine aminotransferase
VAAFEHLNILRERARRVVEADRTALRAFLAANDGVDEVPTGFGTTAFLRLKHQNVEEFLERLRTEQETSAVPGRFFGAPDRFRIGMGVNNEMFVEGLGRVGLALG